MCMMGDPGRRNRLHLTRDANVLQEDEDGDSDEEEDDDDEEEGGNRGDRVSVAFPRVTEEKGGIDAP